MTYLLPISRLSPRLKFTNRLTKSPLGSIIPIGTIRASSTKMATESSTLTHTIHLPRQPDQPVAIVAAAGVSGSDFRCAVDLFCSRVFCICYFIPHIMQVELMLTLNFWMLKACVSRQNWSSLKMSSLSLDGWRNHFKTRFLFPLLLLKINQIFWVLQYRIYFRQTM